MPATSLHSIRIMTNNRGYVMNDNPNPTQAFQEDGAAKRHLKDTRSGSARESYSPDASPLGGRVGSQKGTDDANKQQNRTYIPGLRVHVGPWLARERKEETAEEWQRSTS